MNQNDPIKRPAGRGDRPHPNQRGSALVLTLLVVGLLLLLSLSFTLLVRMSLREMQNRQHLAMARSNARLGMELALARLQIWTGPDTRTTAPGGMWDGTVENLTRPGEILPAGGRGWTGVWDTRGSDERDPGTRIFLGWLVSGLPEAQFLATPPVSGDADSVRLVGPASASDSADWLYARWLAWNSGGEGAAWVVEDQGIKAQLAARRDPPVVSDPFPIPGGGVIPPAIPSRAYPELESFETADAKSRGKLDTLRDGGLLTGSAGPFLDHRADYTPRSLGVLSNSRKGGLRGDLTLAFERADVFERVFPHSEPEKYLVLDADKLSDAADLQANGYIHWAIFRDYYNLKRCLMERDGLQVVDAVYFDKIGLVGGIGGPDEIARGTLAPHQMGPSRNSARHREQPYGDVIVARGLEWENPPSKHNHLGPILSRMQEKAWLEYEYSGVPGDPAVLTSQVQLWTAQYNPYNIGLLVRGNAKGGERGPRILSYPQVNIHVEGLAVGNFNTDPGEEAFATLRESNAVAPLILMPGQSRVYGVEREDVSTGMHNEGVFGPAIADNMIAGVFRSYDITPFTDSEVTVDVTFRFERRSSSNMMHGADMDPPRQPSAATVQHDMEVTQIFYAPFAWDSSGGYAAKSFNRKIPVSQLNENSWFSAGLVLRTTREPEAGALRPLIDANIRAPWINPRWDSSLPVDLSTAAAYSERSEGVGPQFPPLHPEGGEASAYMGAGEDAVRGTLRMILFDIPRRDLISLGQLQHAAAGKFSYEPSYVAGNAYANPRIPLDDWRGETHDTFSVRNGLIHSISGAFNLYDASYLVNQAMFDDMVFTTLPQVRDDYESGEAEIDYARILSGQDTLPNPRFIPYVPEGLTFDEDTLTDRGSADGTEGAFHTNAGFLMVDGAFNVNSVSEAAWEAFLCSTLDLPVPRRDGNSQPDGLSAPGVDRVRFPRVAAPMGDGADPGVMDQEYWTGFRSLTRDEIGDLAQEIVVQVKRRGPFLTRAEFVNRMLRDSDEGRSGPLQAALDAVVNPGTDSDLSLEAGGIPGNFPQGTGFPGQLLQGDILQALEPLIQARSDTFVIRAGGRFGVTGGSAVYAWCEAEVQRVPDPVLSTFPANEEALLRELANPTSAFGRRYRVLSFRWLTEAEL